MQGVLVSRSCVHIPSTMIQSGAIALVAVKSIQRILARRLLIVWYEHCPSLFSTCIR